MRPAARLLTLAPALLLLASCGLAGPGPRETSMDAAGADTFEQDVATARTLTEAFWKDRFARQGLAYRPISAFIPYDGRSGPRCGDESPVPNNAFYCPAGHFIAFDRVWMEALREEMGDGSVYLIIPHEFGHAVQAQLRTEFELNVQVELQADCYAGGTLSALVESGQLIAQPGDADELLLSLEAAGDPTDDWLDPSAHGTAEQRQAAFTTGYENGVGAC
ncbi:hypothetical protein HII36_39800 [Nonomuraea sp. NN258]|uniref:neutral zinc metallopeptidase n=1 Tax=Nonomuraea antri TaxID=2730852 RepID=UPI001568F693|nr:neutral zinc metallopeptidase [Nonomuraea antri]NRQ37932.1 hypothetical protein [Nonomuraea antri]